MMQFTGLEKVIGLIVLIMIIIMVTGCQSRYYPPAPKYEGYVLR